MFSHDLKVFILFFGAVLSLLVGILVYFIFRPHSQIYLIKIFGLSWLYPQSSIHLPSGFLVFLDSIPTATHTFSFSIFSAFTCGLTKTCILSSCAGWVSANFVFEILQLYQMRSSHIAYLEDSNILLKIICQYFGRGIFDWYDLISIGVGGVLAYGALNMATKGNPHECK